MSPAATLGLSKSRTPQSMLSASNIFDFDVDSDNIDELESSTTHPASQNGTAVMPPYADTTVALQNSSIEASNTNIEATLSLEINNLSTETSATVKAIENKSIASDSLRPASPTDAIEKSTEAVDHLAHSVGSTGAARTAELVSRSETNHDHFNDRESATDIGESSPVATRSKKIHRISSGVSDTHSTSSRASRKSKPTKKTGSRYFIGEFSIAGCKQFFSAYGNCYAQFRWCCNASCSATLACCSLCLCVSHTIPHCLLISPTCLLSSYCR